MKLNVYSLYDRAAMTYGHPFYCVNHAVAHRLLFDTIIRGASPTIQAHPEDFELRFIAFFDDETGRFEPVSEIATLTTAKATTDYIRRMKPQHPEWFEKYEGTDVPDPRQKVLPLQGEPDEDENGVNDD